MDARLDRAPTVHRRHVRGRGPRAEQQSRRARGGWRGGYRRPSAAAAAFLAAALASASATMRSSSGPAPTASSSCAVGGWGSRQAWWAVRQAGIPGPAGKVFAGQPGLASLAPASLAPAASPCHATPHDLHPCRCRKPASLPPPQQNSKSRKPSSKPSKPAGRPAGSSGAHLRPQEHSIGQAPVLVRVVQLVGQHDALHGGQVGDGAHREALVHQAVVHKPAEQPGGGGGGGGAGRGGCGCCEVGLGCAGRGHPPPVWGAWAVGRCPCQPAPGCWQHTLPPLPAARAWLTGCPSLRLPACLAQPVTPPTVQPPQPPSPQELTN